MENKIAAFALAGALSAIQFTAASDALARRSHHQRHHRHGHPVATGVAVGVTTGLVINAANESSKCRDFASRCNRGMIEYCAAYDTQCW